MSSTSSISSKKQQKMKYKKSPGAPKRFKSAYMFFSEQMHKVIRMTVVKDKKIRAAEVAKMVSRSWKNLSDEERAPWLDMGRKDRERYDAEKAVYKGPWKVPVATIALASASTKGAPKKPQSAFLAFSNQRRRGVADANPHLTGNEISSVLAQMWKTAPDVIKQQYRDTEAREREAFKRDRAAWEQQVHADLLAAAATETTTTTTSEAQQQEQEQLVFAQAPQCISSFYAALENELRSFGQAQQVVSSNAEPLARVSLPHTATKSFNTFDMNFAMTNATPRMTLLSEKIVPSTDTMNNGTFIPLPAFTGSSKTRSTTTTSSAHEVNYSLDDLLQCDELMEDFSPREDALGARLAKVTDPLATKGSFGSFSSFLG